MGRCIESAARSGSGMWPYGGPGGRDECESVAEKVNEDSLLMQRQLGEIMPWNLTGNAGISAATNFIGTQNSAPLIIKTNTNSAPPNLQEVMQITPSSLTEKGKVGIGTTQSLTQNALFQLHVRAPGGFGGEDGNGVAAPGDVPIVAQSDSTAFGVLNSNGRQVFALNIDNNQGTSSQRGTPTFYDRFDGTWHRCISLVSGAVRIGETPPQSGRLSVDGSVVATSNGAAIEGTGRPGVQGWGDGFGAGVRGDNFGGGTGVIGLSDQSGGVWGESLSASAWASGVRGDAQGGNGVEGFSGGANGVFGRSSNQEASGVYGENMSQGGFGVAGRSNATVRSPTRSGWGAGVLGDNSAGGWAGFFNGDINVIGSLLHVGSGLHIDNPKDPRNRYLNHSFVESPDMLNVYNGNVITDDDGNAKVQLPDYFEALNRDFCYQLTVLGQLAQAIVAKEVTDNTFTIKTDKPGVRVSWQVTGVRQDAWANAHRVEPDVEKPEGERGKYLTPLEHGQPPTAGIYYLEWPASEGSQAE
jgi:hypothetical protein